MLSDASVLRNFAILGWVDHLVELAGGAVLVAHGVMGLYENDPGEIEKIRTAFEEESAHSPGSPSSIAATAAVVGLDALLKRRSMDVIVVSPTDDELVLALRLQDPEQRTWRQGLGVRSRRLDAGEAVSIAIATARRLAFASDDDDARVAYLALNGSRHVWTLGLIQEAVHRGLLDEFTAREGYEKLRQMYRFWGPPWT